MVGISLCWSKHRNIGRYATLRETILVDIVPILVLKPSWQHFQYPSELPPSPLHLLKWDIRNNFHSVKKTHLCWWSLLLPAPPTLLLPDSPCLPFLVNFSPKEPWEPAVMLGEPCSLACTIGDPCCALVRPGDPCCALMSPGESWRALVNPGDPCCALVVPGELCWDFMRDSCCALVSPGEPFTLNPLTGEFCILGAGALLSETRLEH